MFVKSARINPSMILMNRLITCFKQIKTLMFGQGKVARVNTEKVHHLTKVFHLEKVEFHQVVNHHHQLSIENESARLKRLLAVKTTCSTRKIWALNYSLLQRWRMIQAE
jgi:hypothetical protein